VVGSAFSTERNCHLPVDLGRACEPGDFTFGAREIVEFVETESSEPTPKIVE
jgi:hypothetical protein